MNCLQTSVMSDSISHSVGVKYDSNNYALQCNTITL